MSFFYTRRASRGWLKSPHNNNKKHFFIRNIRFSSLLLPCIEFISWIFFYSIPSSHGHMSAREGRKCYIESTMVVWGNEKKRQQNVNKLMQPHRHPPATLPRICGVNLTSPLKKMKTFSVNDGSEIYNNGVGWWRDVLLFFPRLSTISTLVDDQSSSGWWWWEGVQHITVRLQNFLKKLNRDVCISSVVHWNKKKHARGFTCDVLLSSTAAAAVVQPKYEFILFFCYNKNDGMGMTLNFTHFFFCRGDFNEESSKEWKR